MYGLRWKIGVKWRDLIGQISLQSLTVFNTGEVVVEGEAYPQFQINKEGSWLQRETSTCNGYILLQWIYIIAMDIDIVRKSLHVHTFRGLYIYIHCNEYHSNEIYITYAVCLWQVR